MVLIMMLISCQNDEVSVFYSEGDAWTMGFGSSEIPLPETEEPLYIAGYHNGCEIEGVLDLQRVNAVWFDTGSGGVLLIGVDCVGLGRDTVLTIRERLSGFAAETDCRAVNVYATHTHAGADTLGLWGPVGQNGKNAAFLENVIAAAVEAAKLAYENRRTGTLSYGSTETVDFQRDSRLPLVYDSTLHQLRFSPSDGTAGIRILFYAAHAESLRGKNRLLSRDFPGMASDIIREKTGEDTLFVPGAVGGLVMTSIRPEAGDEGNYDSLLNCRITAGQFADYALSITEEESVPPVLGCRLTETTVPLDNSIFMYYRFLGILGNPVSDRDVGETGYSLITEVGLLTLGDTGIALIPGEIFPELVLADGGYEGTVPVLESLAAESGLRRLLTAGLCNDELGYIVPPEDYFLHPTQPYLTPGTDGDNRRHYEETNSTGRNTAQYIAAAFEKLLLTP